jgi:MoxR-like ATPase
MATSSPPPPPEMTDEDVKAVGQLRKARERQRDEIGRVVVGQDVVLDNLLAALLCPGHALLVGVPGLGKTLMARIIARTLRLDFNRIQFTPDLMPSDIIGTDVIEEDPETGRRRLEFIQGPLFTHFLLADEINRAPPKTQSALLQAMQEQEVSVGRRSYRLESPFFVIATQNPIEQEGTYPLQEAQLDRFMFHIPVVYPSREEEVTILKSTTANQETEVRPVLDAAEVVRLQKVVRGVPVASERTGEIDPGGSG